MRKPLLRPTNPTQCNICVHVVSRGTPAHKQLLWFWYKASVFWQGGKVIKFHVFSRQQGHMGTLSKGRLVLWLNKVKSAERKKRTAGVWVFMQLLKIATLSTPVMQSAQDLAQIESGCVNPVQKTVILHLEGSRCSRQTFSLRTWARGSWTDMCHRQLSTWSTLLHQISKCFSYVYRLNYSLQEFVTTVYMITKLSLWLNSWNNTVFP